MKQPDSLTKELILPLTAGIGLAVFAVQMLYDIKAQGDTMTLSMWIAFFVMAAGAVYGFWTSWTRYRQYRQRRQAEIDAAAALAPETAEDPLPVYTPDLTEGIDAGAEAMAQMVIGHRKLLSQFKAELYPSVFQGYCGCLEECLGYLRRYEEESEAICRIAQKTLEILEKDWAASRHKAPDFADQLLISVYLMPALVQSGEPAAMEFAQGFRGCWQKKYPQSVFEIGTYEEILKGFQKKFGCFITTAVCQFQGKADNCYELTQFRHFRDGWLASQPGGPALIEEYYSIAPSVVNLIRLQSDAPAVYRELWETYLKPCLTAIEEQENQVCLERYCRMVEDLKSRYAL